MQNTNLLCLSDTATDKISQFPQPQTNTRHSLVFNTIRLSGRFFFLFFCSMYLAGDSVNPHFLSVHGSCIHITWLLFALADPLIGGFKSSAPPQAVTLLSCLAAVLLLATMKRTIWRSVARIKLRMESRPKKDGGETCSSVTGTTCICHFPSSQVPVSKSAGLSLIGPIDEADPPGCSPLLLFIADIKIKSSSAQQDKCPILPCLLLPRGGHQRWDPSPLRSCLLLQTPFHLGSSGRRRISDKGLVSLLAPLLPSSLSAHVFLI